MSPPHQAKPANGDHPDAEEERSEVEKAHARFQGMETRDAAEAAYVDATLVKLALRNLGASMADLHGQYGKIIGETGRLADAAIRRNEQIVVMVRDGLLRVESFIATLDIKTGARFDAMNSRLDAMESGRATAVRPQLASITNELDAVEDTGIRRSLESKKAHDLLVFEDMTKRAEEMRIRLEAIEKEKHDLAVAAAALAKQKATDDAAAEKRFKRMKDWLGIAIAVGALAVTGWAGFAYAVNQAANKGAAPAAQTAATHSHS